MDKSNSKGNTHKKKKMYTLIIFNIIRSTDQDVSCSNELSDESDARSEKATPIPDQLLLSRPPNAIAEPMSRTINSVLNRITMRILRVEAASCIKVMNYTLFSTQ